MDSEFLKLGQNNGKFCLTDENQRCWGHNVVLFVKSTARSFMDRNDDSEAESGSNQISHAEFKLRNSS